ncbi:MAG: universal stress protein [Fimbriimonas sp.]
MKILAGIDPHQPSKNMTNLIGRLRFPETHAICASIAPLPIASASGFTQWPEQILPDIMDAERDTACRALERAAREFEAFSIESTEVFEIGEASHHLANLAATHFADLIAIGSTELGPTLAFMLGSVGRALTIHAKQSLLIAKGGIVAEGPLRAVFAFDASEYCERSIDELVRLHPEGIEHIELLIVDTPDEKTSPVTSLRGEGAFELGRTQRHGILLEYAEAASKRLRDAGFEVRTLCMSGHVNDVVRGLVIDSRADLVILGAQGHGWLERALFGSIALAQAVAEPHSVLILRPR